MKRLAAGFLSASLFLSSALPQGPSVANQKKLVTEFYKLDRSQTPRPERELDILMELSELPPLSAAEVKRWRKELGKRWKKGPRLEKGGTNYLFDDKRGKYIVGGRTKGPLGLAICMHGGGLGSGEASSAYRSYQGAISSMGWVGIFPEVLEKTERGWTDSGTEEFVLELVDRAVRTFGVDPDQVYFVGHSMGGYGSWTLGAHHADRVAALAPSAGAPTPILGANGNPVDIIEGVIPSLRNVPLVIFQSTDDVQVPPAANQAAVAQLKKAKERWGGFPYEYWEVNNRGHGAPLGGHPAHLNKIKEFKRDSLPSKVVWQPELDWKRQFYWLWWEKPVQKAIVEAVVDWEARTLQVTMDADPKGLHLLLHGDLVDLNQEFVVSVNGEETWRGIPERKLDVLLDTGRHGDPRMTFEARIPVVAK
jgi:pimeloyl-ACP methyl ester carboxylesterase